jgi:hypothetical protein
VIGARGRHLKIVKPIDRDAPRRWLNDHRRPSLSMAAARAIPAIAPRAIRNGGFSGIVKPRRPETVAGVTSGPNITIHVVSDLFSSTAPDPRYCYPVGWPGNVR